MSTKFTEDHEWIVLEDNGIALIGITQFAQEQLGDLVYVELPELDAEFSQGDDVSVIESVKAASELKAPITGKVVEVNETLTDEPELINQDPMGAGWICRIELSNPAELDELMDEDSYNASLD